MQLSPKKSLSIVGLIAVALIIQAFTFSSPAKDVELSTAIKSKKIDATIQSIGRHEGKSISIKLKNNTSSNLRVKIPAGTLFHPEDDGEQTLIHLEENFIALKPKGEYKGFLAGFCTESKDRCPTDGSGMSIAANANPKFTKLSDYLKGKKISKSVYQDAVWAISDGKSVANIDAINPATVELKKFVANLTGQKNTWYSSPQSRHVDESGNIVQETVIIKGKLEFDCKKNAKVRQDIYKENGESVFVSEKYMTAVVPHITYKFTLRVRGWEKGKYYIRIHDGTDEIKRYYFNV